MFSCCEITLACIGKFGSWYQDICCPLQKFFFGNGVCADILPARLENRHADSINIIDAVKQLQRSQGITEHLRIFLCFDKDSFPVLVVNHRQRSVCDNDTVSGSKSLRHIFGKVQSLFHQDNRVRAALQCLYSLLHHILGIALRTVFHFFIKEAEAFCRISSIHSKC